MNVQIIALCFVVWVKIIVCEEQLNSTKNDDIIIYEIKYRILEEKIPHLLTDLIMENVYITNLKFQQVLSGLNIEITESFVLDLLSFPGYEVLMEESNANLSSILALIISKIPNRRQNLKAILNLLGIDQLSFNDAILYGEEDELAEFLQAVTYNESVTSTVYTLANIPLPELVRIAETEIINPIGRKAFKECVDIFGKRSVVHLLNQTFYGLQLSDVRNSSLIYELLANYTSMLNLQSIWAIETKHGILSIPKTHYAWNKYEKYAEIYLEDTLNHNITEDISNVFQEVGKTFSIIQTAKSNTTVPVSSITIVEDFTSLPKHCVFFTKSDEGIKSIIATEYSLKKLFIHVKYIGPRINFGSPFICDLQLEALLIGQDEETLRFMVVGDVSIDSDYESGDFDFDPYDDIDDYDNDGSLAKQVSVICFFVLIGTLLY